VRQQQVERLKRVDCLISSHCCCPKLPMRSAVVQKPISNRRLCFKALNLPTLPDMT
jgi:hypothetical protein